MSVALESFLARLYTDPRVRAEFLRNRRRAAEAAGLPEADVQSLVGVNEFALVLTAQTFDRKRARRTPSSLAPGHIDKLRQRREARIGTQGRELRVDVYENKLRFPVFRRAIEIHKRLVGIAKRGRHLGEMVVGHVLRRRPGLEPLHDAASARRSAATRRDIRIERERL